MLEKEDWWIQKAVEIEDKFGTIPPTGRSPKKHKDGSFNCLIDAFFEKQKNLPPEQRSSSCMIACKCRKCSPHM
jgi:hypothetical protein